MIRKNVLLITALFLTPLLNGASEQRTFQSTIQDEPTTQVNFDFYITLAESIREALLRKLSETPLHAQPILRSSTEDLYTQHFLPKWQAFQMEIEKIREQEDIDIEEAHHLLDYSVTQLLNAQEHIYKELKFLLTRFNASVMPFQPSWQADYPAWLIMPVNEAVKRLLEKYHIHGPQDCITSVGKHPNPQNNTIGTCLLCVLGGYKDLYMGDAGTIEDHFRMIEEPDTYITIFNALRTGLLKIIHGKNPIIYRANCPACEKRALLLTLAHLQNNLVNDYIRGKLLGYPEDDIKFFYEVRFFRDDFKRMKPEYANVMIGTTNYVDWPADAQKYLEQWEQATKHENPEDHTLTENQRNFIKRYAHDKTMALQWITANEYKSIEELKSEIKKIAPHAFIEYS